MNEPRVNEYGQIIDQNGQVILNEYGQPTYLYSQGTPVNGFAQQQPYNPGVQQGQQAQQPYVQPYPYYQPQGVNMASYGRNVIVLGVLGILFGIFSFLTSPFFGILFSVLAITNGRKAGMTDKSKETLALTLGIIGIVLSVLCFVLGIIVRVTIF